jgi:EAL domain-containing protein (putative c-di-GMP-specific phosphodiesterase class I)
VVPYVSVNVSAHQFRDPGLVEIVAAALAAAGLDPARLVIEVSERDALADVVTAVATIERLSDLGVGVALDNFGAGFASLSYLVRLHPRYVKIDHAFSRPAIDSLYNDALLESIVGLGAKLHLPILAEGIETSDQLGRLRRFGCEISQGFLFSPAVPASDVAAMIAELREAVASTRD